MEKSYNIEDELNAAWQKAGQLQQRIVEKSGNLEEEAQLLEGKIDDLTKTPAKNHGETRVDILAHLCLLSEVCSAIDFDRLISARERFQGMYPKHFDEYLAHLSTLSWHTNWSGCLECRHFSGRCNLNLKPIDKQSDGDGLEMECHQKTKRSRHL